MQPRYQLISAQYPVWVFMMADGWVTYLFLSRSLLSVCSYSRDLATISPDLSSLVVESLSWDEFLWVKGEEFTFKMMAHHCIANTLSAHRRRIDSSPIHRGGDHSIISIYTHRAYNQSLKASFAMFSFSFFASVSASINCCRDAAVAPHAHLAHQERARHRGALPLHLQGHHGPQAADRGRVERSRRYLQ